MVTPVAMNLLDWTKTRAPRGGVATVANVLSQRLDILQDALFVEGNLDTGHRVTVTTGLPDVYWRSYNLGVPSSKMTTAQVDEQCAKMESHSEADRELADLGGNPGAYRALRANHFIESMGQKLAETAVYGNAAIGDGFTGLAPRYSAFAAGNGGNIVNGGGSTANAQTSVWLLCFSPETIFFTFPRGMQAGLVTRDLDVQLIRRVDANGVERTFEAYVEIFKWDVGLVVADWRYAVRICNLQVADLQGLSGTQVPTGTGNVLHSVLKAIDILPSQNMGKCILMGNRLVKNAIVRIAAEKSSAAVLFQNAANQFGQQRSELTIQGIPFRINDKILNTESVVS